MLILLPVARMQGLHELLDDESDDVRNFAYYNRSDFTKRTIDMLLLCFSFLQHRGMYSMQIKLSPRHVARTGRRSRHREGTRAEHRSPLATHSECGQFWPTHAWRQSEQSKGHTIHIARQERHCEQQRMQLPTPNVTVISALQGM
jgi:hypothetical protein